MVLRTRPSPEQVEQGVDSSPEPPQAGQGATCWNMPSGVRTACTTWPCPPQVLQVVGVVPALTPEPSHVSHGSRWLMLIFLLHPNTASIKSSDREYLCVCVCGGGGGCGLEVCV